MEVLDILKDVLLFLLRGLLGIIAIAWLVSPVLLVLAMIRLRWIFVMRDRYSRATARYLLRRPEADHAHFFNNLEEVDDMFRRFWRWDLEDFALDAIAYRKVMKREH